MASRYLLEFGEADGYLLEDGSGVFILESESPLVDKISINLARALYTKKSFSMLYNPILVETEPPPVVSLDTQTYFPVLRGPY
jgi:hypothetical protein